MQPAPEPSPEPVAVSSVSIGVDADGVGQVRASLAPDDYRVFEAAIRESRDALFHGGHPDVNWADALIEMCHRSLDTVAEPAAGIGSASTCTSPGNADLTTGTPGAVVFTDARGSPLKPAADPSAPTSPPPEPAGRYVHPLGERLDRWAVHFNEPHPRSAS